MTRVSSTNILAIRSATPFCDDKGIPELERAPAAQPLLSAFVAHMAAAYSGKTISNYLNGVRAWHILHSVPWVFEKMEMDTMLRASKLTPDASKRKARLPYTPDFIAAVKRGLVMDDPLDAAVFACLSTCFYASARLGEFTVRTLGSFRPNMHITTRNLSYDQDRGGHEVTVLHLPSTKAAGRDGEDVYWATQAGETDPTVALQNHLCVNEPSEASHQFAYRVKNAHRPLTKTKFLERVGKAARAAGLEPLRGHGIRIGSTLEYLLRGVPFDVMKAKGRWAGDSFLLYLRKYAVVIAPYIQEVPKNTLQGWDFECQDVCAGVQDARHTHRFFPGIVIPHGRRVHEFVLMLPDCSLSACRPLFAPPFISVGERTPHLCLVPQHATPLVPPALPRAMPRRFLSPLAVPRTFIMLSPSLPAAPRALTCHSFVPPAMLARSPAGPYRRRLCPACRPVTPSRRYCMPHVPPCYSLPPLATPHQQGASRPESLSDADPLRVQMPPRPSSTAIQSPALCFHPPPRPSSDPTDTRAQVSLNAPSQTN
ncbi:hypothetical protein EDB84DRAFT_1561627 [Lactarius hengduanensis]|nr:hypothetical protein EDB84DRAFT_1561627 [Lactarius hengduanensis]